MERRLLVLGGRRGAEHLRARSLVEAGLDASVADRFEQPDRSHARDVIRVLGNVERHAHVRLGSEVIDLVGLDLVNEAYEARRVGQVRVMQKQAHLLLVGVAIEVVDALGVEGGRPAHQAVDLVALVEQLLSEEGPVLPGDAGDDGTLHRPSMLAILHR
jgi:hypothetical protein